MIDITNEEFELLSGYLVLHYGLEIPMEKRYLFKTRLQGLMQEENIETFKNLYDNITSGNDQRLSRQLVAHMTTNETSFFRDRHPFETLKNVLLPAIGERKKDENLLFPPRIRIWSAGCSTGQEPYSIAITVHEWLKEQDYIKEENISIIATDISTVVLGKAERGLYTEKEISSGLEQEHIDLYFQRSDDFWQIRKEIKKMISFKELNLSLPFSDEFSCFDIIFCRNVVIYFSVPLKEKIMNQFHLLLKSDGILLLGAIENLYNIEANFSSHHCEGTIWYSADYGC